MFNNLQKINDLTEELKAAKKHNDYLEGRIDDLNNTIKEDRRKNTIAIEDLERAHKQKIEDLTKAHEYEMLDAGKTLQYATSDEIQNLKKALDEANTKIAVLEEANKHLEKMTDLNADIIDVKDVMNQLIKKLPEIKLSSLTVQAKD